MAQSAALVMIGVTMLSLSFAIAGGIHYLGGVLGGEAHADDRRRSV